jgi:predicted Zn-dependent peptidase
VVGALTSDQLRAFHAERYRPADVVIAAAGSIDHDTLVEMVERCSPQVAESSSESETPDAALEASATGSGQPGEAAHPVRGGAAAPLPSLTFERRVQFLRRETEQYHLCLGGRGIARDDERRFALRVLDNVLGGGPSSRLFQEVRERRGLAYSVFSFANQYAHTGEVGLYVGTRPENLAQALEVIAGELERFVREPADAQELERSRENAKGRLVLALESTGARMNRLGSSVLCDLPILSVEEIIARIDAVTVEDLRELATDLFRGPSLSVAAIGPDEDALRKALGPLEAVAA